MMKKIIYTIAFSLFATLANAQESNKEMLYAIKQGDAAQLDTLIDTNNINECLEIGESSYNYLAISIKLKSLKSVAYFLDKKADIEGECTGKTALMYAAKYGHLDIAKYLIKRGADVKTTYNGRSARDYANRYQHSDISDYLTEVEKE